MSFEIYHPLQYQKIISVFSKFSFCWLLIESFIKSLVRWEFSMQLQKYSGPKNSESAAAYYCLASFLIQDQISAQATQKILTKNGRWTCFETCHFRINVHNRYVYLHIWKYIFFRIGRLTNIESFFPTFFHLITLCLMQFWRQNSKI